MVGATRVGARRYGSEVTRSDLEVATVAATRAADIVRSGFRSGVRAEWKGSVNPVTEVDRRAEDACLAVISEHRPNDAILAEEAGGSLALTARTWLVDPLDGTVNFVHGLHSVAVSVALWEDGQPLVGVVIDTLRDERYVATRGGGALADGRPMQVSTTPALSDALVSTGFGYDRTERADHYAAVLGRVLARSRGVRRIGSAALDLCWVADGRLDAHWEEQLKPWDTAAASLIIQEAGGTITSAAGSDFDLEAPSVVASNGLIHRELVSVLDLDP